MKKLKLLALFATGLIVGAVAGGSYAFHVLGLNMLSKEVDLAFKACEEAEWLAQLRLNEVPATITNLEKTMDIELATLAQWETVKPLDKQKRERRDRFLVPVKVYHESFPSSGEEATTVNSLLAAVPGRNLKKLCKSGVCRLDDLRRTTPASGTNSVPH